MLTVSKVHERRSRQNPVRQGTYNRLDTNNPETSPQYFQVSVNIIEARKLAWLNPHSANSYVIVVLGNKKRRTGIRRNMQEPCYREHFMFEMYSSIEEIQRSSVWLAVMEPRCCAPPRVLGEASVDLAAVWVQPYHQVFRKWAQLSLPQNPAAGAMGFLKIDISIIFRGDVHAMPMVIDDEKVEDNLLLPSGSEQQPANYVITIYGVFGLPSLGQAHGDRRFGKPPSTYVRVTFCDLTGKTGMQHRTYHPTFCEQISIVEMFPNMSEMIRFEVCSGEGYSKVLASTSLELGQISHDGENGFLPTFGPSLLHMYGGLTGSVTATNEAGPFHRGALLVSLKTIVPYYQQELKSINVEPVPPILPENHWLIEDFCIFCPVLEVSMLDRHVGNKPCGVALTLGELPTDQQGDEEFVAMMTELKARKLHYTGSLEVVKSMQAYGYLNFPKAFPILQFATRLPDFRFRMYRNNMVHGIVADLEQTLFNVEARLNKLQYNTPSELMDELNGAIDTTAANLLKYLDIIQYSLPSSGSLEDTTLSYSTELDQKQAALQKEEIEKMYQQLTKRAKCTATMNLFMSVMKPTGSSMGKKQLKFMLAELKGLAENIKSLIYKTSEGWPDIVIWLLHGGSRVAFYKIPAADVIYSAIPEQNGRSCGRIQTIYLKPLKCPKHPNTMSSNCFCIAGKVELMLWMGLYRQIQAFESTLPKGYALKVKECDMYVKTTTIMVECRVFISKAKLSNDVISNQQISPFVRVNVLNSVRETSKKLKTFMPVWNQVIKIQKLIFATQERLTTSPPNVLVEVCHSDNAGKWELLGMYKALPVLEDRPSYEFAPRLEWCDLHKGTEYTGQVLMSVQLLQIPETLIKSTMYAQFDESYVMPEMNDVTPDPDNVEMLPYELMPKYTTYKVDIYWWGLRDVNSARRPCVTLEIDELVLKSDIITDNKTNCNFPNGRTTETFESLLDEVYCPPLTIKLYDNSTFGRTLFLGSNVVKNPTKYMVSWLPKTEREASLESASIISSNFFQVGQMLFVRKSSSSTSIAYLKPNYPSKTKRSAWRKLFSIQEPDEEEYVLLPMFSKEKDQIKDLTKGLKSPENKDWWTRYFASQKDSKEEDNPSDKITIIDTELEQLPEFSKFKDWCSTIKLYNGNKTGIPEKDDQLCCGFLKAGIAIYRWPPTQGTEAVSTYGVDLNEGDHPSNESTKFLVRVYVVKATDLVPKPFTGRSDSYLVISCGNKHLGDRKNYVPNNLNPIFGRALRWDLHQGPLSAFEPAAGGRIVAPREPYTVLTGTGVATPPPSYSESPPYSMDAQRAHTPSVQRLRRMYEFRCTLPEDYLLSISLFDYDANQPDEMIGSTTIDLEDRIYTKHRARVGVPCEYNITGPAKWRDSTKPSAILEELCSVNHLPPPGFPDAATVIVNGVEYRDTDVANKNYTSASERKENICLNLLRKWQTLPMCGYHLVPEHVELRRLVHPEKPGIIQGKLQMWVDIYPMEPTVYVPTPVDITPRKSEEYELRVIVWNVQRIEFEDPNNVGKRIMNLYARVWLGTSEYEQYTEVDYNTTQSSCSFNWRMIFHFQYQHAEKKLVMTERGPFTEVEERVPPFLVVQIMDSEATSQDDFLASLSLNLTEMPRGFKLANECTLEGSDQMRKMDLFSALSTRRWWPLINTDQNTGTKRFAGAIDLELTVLPKEKAILMPVGLGRQPPYPLPDPNRACSSRSLNIKELYENKELLIIAVVVFIVIACALGYHNYDVHILG